MQTSNYPDKYDKNDVCTWELTCSNPNGLISISCDDFKTEDKTTGQSCSDADFLRIRDSNNDKIGDYCGTKGPDLTTTENFMKLKFKTDGDSIKKRGFSCTAVCSVPTTTTTSTTTTALDFSGSCTLDWTASDGGSATWASPGYDGVTNYVNADYCCWLNVTVPSTYSFFMVTMAFDSNSYIHETNFCVGDRITYYSSSYPTSPASPLCGNIGGQSLQETILATPEEFALEWCSDTTDGGTDVGFSMTLSGLDPLGKK